MSTIGQSATGWFSAWAETDRADCAWPISVRVGTLLLAAVVTIPSLGMAVKPEGNIRSFAADWETFIRLALCAACGLYGLAHIRRTLRELVQFPGAWAVLLGLWVVATLPFAITPMYCAGSCMLLWCMILFAPAVLLQLGGRRTIVTILVALLIEVAAVWFLSVALPDLGRSTVDIPEEFRGQGIDFRLGGCPQTLGLQVALATVLILVLRYEGCVRRSTLVMTLGLTLLTLAFTQSRTSVLACVAAIAVLSLRWARPVWLLMAGCAAITAACLALLIFGGDLAGIELEDVADRLARTGEAQEIYSLTGRTEIWAYALEKIGQSPWMGYGYGSPRALMSTARLAAFTSFETIHAHNIFLNMALCGGVVGVLLLAAMFLSLGWGFVRSPDAVPDMVLVLAFVGGMTEAVVFSPMPRLYSVIWLIALFWRQVGASLGGRTTSLCSEQEE